MRRVHLLLCALPLATLLGCDELSADNFAPPTPMEAANVQAMGWVIGVDEGLAQATLVITAGSGTPRYIGGIIEPVILIGEDRVPMASTDTAGIYVVSSRADEALAIQPGQRYDFSFGVRDDEGTTTDYLSTVSVPDDDVNPVIPEVLARYLNEDVDVELDELSDGAVVQVFNSQEELTFTSLYFTGPGTIADALRSVKRYTPPRITVPAEAFPAPGQYRIELADMGIAEPGSGAAAELAVGSWFGAGVIHTLYVDVL